MNTESLVRYITSFLVDKPESIQIKEITGEEVNILELRVDENDIGKVIGKNGRIAKSLRTILAAASAKAGKTYNLEIVD
jgi:predicted RNA-binding protein YlqC (UPF0109 family)